MNDDRFDREIRRFLDWDISQIDGAPSRDEMVYRLAPLASGGRGVQRWAPGSPAIRLILVLALLAALVAGAFAAGVWRTQRNPIAVAPTPAATPASTPRPSIERALEAGAWYVDIETVRVTFDVPAQWTDDQAGDRTMVLPNTTPQEQTATLEIFDSIQLEPLTTSPSPVATQ